VPVFKEMKVQVPLGEVMRRLGRKKSMSVTPGLAAMVNEEVEHCRELMGPMAVFDRFAITHERGGIVSIKDAFSIHSGNLSDWVAGCDELVIMVVTVGPDIVARARRLIEEGEVTRAMIVDAIGSETVEELADVVNRIIRNTVRKAATKRYSPGYGDWKVTDQKALLGLVGAEEIGVTVNEASQMIPEKTISAVIGLAGMEGAAGGCRRQGGT